jgi:hypothetical protein
MLKPVFSPETKDKVLESYKPYAWFSFLNIVRNRLFHLTYKPELFFKFLIPKIEKDFLVSYLGIFKITDIGNTTALVSFQYSILKSKKYLEQ